MAFRNRLTGNHPLMGPPDDQYDDPFFDEEEAEFYMDSGLDMPGIPAGLDPAYDSDDFDEFNQDYFDRDMPYQSYGGHDPYGWYRYGA